MASAPLLVLTLLLAQAAAAAEGTLRTIEEVLALSPAEAAEARPLRVSGIMLVCIPGASFNVLHDGKHGIFVSSLAPHPETTGLRAGDRVEIEGVTGAGHFRPRIQAPAGGALKIKVLGRGEEVQPLHLQPDELMAPGLDCQWVEFEGEIESTLTDWWPGFTIRAGGHIFAARMEAAEATKLPVTWCVGPIRVRAVAAVTFNDRRQMTSRIFVIPGPEFVRPLDSITEEELFGLPLARLSQVLRVDSPSKTRVRLRGTVTTADQENGIFMRADDGALRVATAQPLSLKPGDIVDVVGWPQPGPFKPEIKTAIYRRVGQGPPPVATATTVESILSGTQEAELVSLQAEWVDQYQTPESRRCLLRTKNTVFEARLPSAGDAADRLPFTPGSIVEVTGVCQGVLTKDYRLPVQARTFTLSMRNREDLRLVAAPPWWNTQRSLWVLGATAAAAAITTAWAVTLRRRVARQMAIISRQLERQSALGERQRIARELHDTLEQELVGMSIQLETAGRHLKEKPAEAERSLEIAKRMLRHSRAESRSSIRDLRSMALEELGLLGAVEELVRPLADGAGVELKITSNPGEDRLPRLHANHLLRIAHEGVANAIQHGSPARVTVDFDFHDDCVVLEVADDGCGFDRTASVDETEHFGLQGMQERTEKMSGRLLLESTLGKGTRVLVTIPLTAGNDRDDGAINS
ncbi:MAG TPA: sensor histidine kinase [Chthoniobacteraceae bacterium]|jgi:signal transduction histidine kinase